MMNVARLLSWHKNTRSNLADSRPSCSEYRISSRDTRQQYDGKQYRRDALVPASKAETNALADYVSPDPAGLLARAAQEVNNHNEEAAMKRTATDIGRNSEASATSCLAQAKTPAERIGAANAAPAFDG
jgi:hypothetical protein